MRIEKTIFKLKELSRYDRFYFVSDRKRIVYELISTLAKFPGKYGKKAYAIKDDLGEVKKTMPFRKVVFIRSSLE